MPTLNKKKKLTLTLGTAITGAAISAGTVSASADTTVYVSQGTGQCQTVTNPSAPNQSVIDNLNSQLNALIEESNGNVKSDDGQPVMVTNDQANAIKDAITKLQTLIQQYNEYKAQLEQQQRDYAALLGKSPTSTIPTDTITLDPTNAGQSVTDMQSTLDKMKAMVDANTDIINQDTVTSTTTSNALKDAVIAANNEIASRQANVTHVIDGIQGNNAAIKQKAQDSDKVGTITSTKNGTTVGKAGVNVDTTVTNANNDVKPDIKPTTTTKVSTLDEVATNQARIDAAIDAANKPNQQAAQDSDTYKQNALKNIDAINQWLQKAQNQTDDVANQQDTINKSGAVGTMDDYKSTYTKKLQDLEAQIKDKVKAGTMSQASADQLTDQIDKALAKLKASNITQNITTHVDDATDVNFGDIGLADTDTTNTADGANSVKGNNTAIKDSDGSINGTMATVTANLTDSINTGLTNLKASNAKALANIKPKITANESSMDKFIDAVNKGGAGSQISQDFLNEMQIYQANVNGYDTFIKNALAQTSSQDSNITNAINNATNSNGVLLANVGNSSIASVSAAIYKNYSPSGMTGFGSVMLPNTNINNMGVTVSGEDGAQVVTSQGYNGGAQGLYNDLASEVADTSHYSFYSDIQNQYFNSVGAGNTLIVVSDKPQISLTLPSSFVYTKDDGTTGAANVKLSVGINAADGSDVAADANAIASTWGAGYAIGVQYIYYFAISPATGKLAIGGAYLLPLTAHPNDGDEGHGGLSGEMKLGQAISLPNGDGAEMRPSASAQMTFGEQLRFRVQVDGSDPAAAAYAKYAPLYISDIDDGQKLSTPAAPGTLIATNEVPNITTSNSEIVVSTPDMGLSTDTSKTTNIDNQSIAIYHDASTSSGLSDIQAGILHEGVYSDIDVSLFSPFGIVGAPTLDINAINDAIDTFDVKDPSAKAKTTPTYTISSSPEMLTYLPPTPNPVENMAANVVLPSFKPDGNEVVSSNNSFIVTKKGNTDRHVSSGNSLVIKTVNSDKRTASGNSLVIRSVTTTLKTASGNSLVVRTQKPTHLATGSGNSLVVHTVSDVKKSGTGEQLALVNGADPVVTTNPDGTHSVAMSVYVDSSLLSTAHAAVADWQSALKEQGVNLNVTYTTNIADLKKGVTLAILEANNSDERLDSQQDSISAPTVADLGGLTTEVSNDVLTPDGENDIYNSTGTVTAGDTLKNTVFTIQLNTQGLSKLGAKDLSLNGYVNEDVLKHELGHVFGLSHDDTDSLMSENVSDAVFTGIISVQDAQTAAQDLISNPAIPKDLDEI